MPGTSKKKKTTEKPKVRRAKNWLTEDEIKMLFNLEDIPGKDKLILRLLYHCAFRVSELCTLKVGDIEAEAEQIILEKSKYEDDPVPVPIYGEPLNMVQKHIKKNKLKEDDYIFPSRAGTPINRRSVFRIVRRLAAKAGIKKEIGTHTFRRTRATHLLNRGMGLEQVSRLLRHKNLYTTMKYLKLTVDKLRNKMKEFDNLA